MRLKRRLNKIPFIVLFIIQFIILAFTYYKKRDKSYLVLLFSNIGFAYIFENLVLNLFNGYKYYPSILKNNQQDNIAGAIFSQAVYVPIMATAISAFRLGWKWKLLFSAYFVLIEYLFLYWKIFRKKWWKTYYTFFFLLIFFNGSDIWHRLLKMKHPIVKGITSYLSIYAYIITTLFIPAIFNKLKMGFGKFRSWRVHFMIVPIYSYILSGITLTTYHSKLKYSNVLGFSTVLIIDFLLYTFKVFRNIRTIYFLIPIHISYFFMSKKLFNMIYDVDTDDRGT
jgi:hypothetical protein